MGQRNGTSSRATTRYLFAMAIGATVAWFVCEATVLIFTKGDLRAAGAVMTAGGTVSSTFFFVSLRRREG
ncbi:hypothetical protein [Actinomadura violacea]|uniref:Uncharacterized protein n=1 Tax=Actinomadura violacea TaxID=2819934 RepID=A0ABS3RV71_9ACTN|nr:hypothetical protein [Actinomadura violacea]MBO2460651.1 hypothetical protein [Actinomadura violacea]